MKKCDYMINHVTLLFHLIQMLLANSLFLVRKNSISVSNSQKLCCCSDKGWIRQTRLEANGHSKIQ